MKPKVHIFWFRRDLRLHDNHGLFQAQQTGLPVLPVFIFDTDILHGLDIQDRRVSFIHKQLTAMHAELQKIQSGIRFFFSTPLEAFKQLFQDFDIQGVWCNHDYEPYAIQRDTEIRDLFAELGIAFHSFKDQVVFEKSEVVKDNQEPYTVFTPYSKKWKLLYHQQGLTEYPVQLDASFFYQETEPQMPTLSSMGFEEVDCPSIQFHWNESLITQYHETRDIPAITGTTRAGIHLRFGTVSVRSLTKMAAETNEKFWNELIWREFYQQILFHFPHVVHNAFKKNYDNIDWVNNAQDFERWCEGTTGYPLVDAGMRELNQTGWMHNRVRMVVASFLTKHLLIDWRWGEAYFAKHLLDFDLASNNGGWQWAAGSGVDAAPYFRVFNPTLQVQKFDPDLKYIRQWIPEFDSLNYPKPIVQHEFARARCLEVYKKALSSNT